MGASARVPTRERACLSAAAADGVRLWEAADAELLEGDGEGDAVLEDEAD